jgi:hypothetical protein
MQPREAFSWSIILGAGSKFFFGETMTEIIFIVEEAPEGGYAARALGESILLRVKT